MTKLISTLLAVAALAVPAAALAKHSDNDSAKRPPAGGLFAVGTGTATSGTFKSRKLGSGTYTAAIAATATTPTTTTTTTTTTPTTTAPAPRRFVCSRATGTVTLTSTGATAGTLSGTVSGRLCTAVAATAKLKAVFFGKLAVTTATGSAASAAGAKGFAGYATRADGTTRLFLVAGRNGIVQALRQRFHR